MGGLAVGPPQFQAVGDEITDVTRRAKHHVQLSRIHLENAGWGKHPVGVLVVISRGDCLLSAGNAVAGKLADLHLGIGVQRDRQRLRIIRGLRMHLLQMGEDGVGLGKFFETWSYGRALADSPADSECRAT